MDYAGLLLLYWITNNVVKKKFSLKVPSRFQTLNVKNTT